MPIIIRKYIFYLENKNMRIVPRILLVLYIYFFCIKYRCFLISSSIYPPFLPLKINKGGNLSPDAEIHNIKDIRALSEPKVRILIFLSPIFVIIASPTSHTKLAFHPY